MNIDDQLVEMAQGRAGASYDGRRVRGIRARETLQDARDLGFTLVAESELELLRNETARLRDANTDPAENVNSISAAATSLSTRHLLAREALSLVVSQNQKRGYPNWQEWQAIVNAAKKALLDGGAG